MEIAPVSAARSILLVARAWNPMQREHIEAVHRMLLEQLNSCGDGPRVLVLPSHVGVKWLQPGDEIPAPCASQPYIVIKEVPERRKGIRRRIAELICPDLVRRNDCGPMHVPDLSETDKKAA